MLEEVHKDSLKEDLTISKDTGSSTEIANDLSSGILNSCEAELTSVSKELNDFTNQQDDLIEKLSKYNVGTETNPIYQQLKDAMDLLTNEMDRLSFLRQEMTTIQERSQKLIVRMEKLRGKAEEKERRDEELVAQFIGTTDEGVPVQYKVPDTL